jgi:type IV secretion system protein TrbI
MGVTWMALRPATFKLIADTQSKVSTDRRRPPEEFANAPGTYANAPGTYANAPKLGAPLPGNLGRPILRAQRQMATETDGVPAPDQAADRAAQAAETERQRIVEEKRKVREAGVMLPLSRPPSLAERIPEPSQSQTDHQQKRHPQRAFPSILSAIPARRPVRPSLLRGRPPTALSIRTGFKPRHRRSLCPLGALSQRAWSPG